MGWGAGNGKETKKGKIKESNACFAGVSSVSSPLVRFSCDLDSNFSSNREEDIKVEITFVNVNFPYKRVISTVFSELFL